MMKKNPIEIYKGVIVPMVTPFNENGDIDSLSAVKLINYLLDNKTIPFILGTTGEATSIPSKQREVLVKILLENKRNNIPAIVGVNGLTFSDTIKQANKFFKWGTDSVVITLPNYFELNEDQIFNYYDSLSDKIKGDIILYNIPKTVHMSISISVIEKLSYKKNIIGIKDSELNEERLIQSLKLWKDRDDFFHFTGVNALMLKGLELGSKGVVPSTANFAPELYTGLFDLVRSGDLKKAGEVHQKTIERSKSYQKGNLLGESLAALKCVMSEYGLCGTEVLPPLSKKDC